MPVECLPSNVCSDVRCAVCGQGFLVFAERQVRAHISDLRQTVQQVLRQQHHAASDHPACAFTIDCSMDVPQPLFA